MLKREIEDDKLKTTIRAETLIIYWHKNVVFLFYNQSETNNEKSEGVKQSVFFSS